MRETDPSGRAITTSYDTGGSGWRTQVSGTRGTANSTYADGISYEPTGALRSMNMAAGTNLMEQHGYNNRLQAAGVRVGTALNSSPTDCLNPSNADLINLSFNYTAWQNNGNLSGQTISYQGPGEPFQQLTQNYGVTPYDGVNRLTSFSKGSAVSQNYQHDAYGNHWVSANSRYCVESADV